MWVLGEQVSRPTENGRAPVFQRSDRLVTVQPKTVQLLRIDLPSDGLRLFDQAGHNPALGL